MHRMSEPESLGATLQQFVRRLDHIPEEVRYMPDEGVCATCDRLIRNHDGVEKALAARGLRYWDEEKLLYVNAQPIPFCMCEVKSAEKAKRQMADANLPSTVQGATPRSTLPASLENFDARPGTEDAHIAALDYTVGNTPSVIMFRGGRGTGKTHLLEAIGRSYLGQGMSVRYELVPALLTRIRAGFGRDSIEQGEQEMYRCHTAQLLILDDLGAEKPSEWVREKVFELVDERYSRNRLLVVATNCSFNEMDEALGERIASRLFDDITNKVQRVTMTCGDYRRGDAG